MRLQLLCLPWLLLTACGDDPAPDPLRNAAGFCSAWSERVCSEGVVNRCGASSIEKCRASQSAFCLDRVTDEKYTRRNAEGCLDAVAEGLRDDQVNPREYAALIEFGGACDELISGTGKADDTCREDTDCDKVEGYECVKMSGSRDGACQRAKRRNGGDKCNTVDSVCSEGYYCDGRNCLAKLDVGEMCSDTAPCSDELLCRDSEDTGAPTCIEKVETGGKDDMGEDILCSSNDECQSGLCDRIAKMSTGRCVKYIVLSVNTELCTAMR